MFTHMAPGPGPIGCGKAVALVGPGFPMALGGPAGTTEKCRGMWANSDLREMGDDG